MVISQPSVSNAVGVWVCQSTKNRTPAKKVLAASGVEPNGHGAVVHDLDLIEVKRRVTHQIVFDDLFKVVLINLDLRVRVAAEPSMTLRRPVCWTAWQAIR